MPAEMTAGTTPKMTDVAALYRASSRMSEEPSMDSIVTGIRGLRTYAARAVRALEAGNMAAKIEAVQRGSELLAFLQGITPAGEGADLGGRLSGLYTGLHVKMAQAHANDDAGAFRALAAQFGQLETELKQLAER